MQERTVTVRASGPLCEESQPEHLQPYNTARDETVPESACQLYSNSPLLSYSPFYGILTIFMILFEAGRYI